MSPLFTKTNVCVCVCVAIISTFKVTSAVKPTVFLHCLLSLSPGFSGAFYSFGQVKLEEFDISAPTDIGRPVDLNK